ncbi:hypothetical protein [Pedobacter namyangjuensis]|uniref:hypothetical protein n=1 Tax=Pedobacter namyangjuensis TaxID=600626 RepID=UPI0013B36248|nr:hypothetical protein [Pedobacter namyangjuensis]
MITSMNLYDFSQNNNIEAGILIEASNRFIGGLTSVVGATDLDNDAYSYFAGVI